MKELPEGLKDTKKYMEEIFVPALHNMIKNINPVKYNMWGGNLCRQTAVYGAYILTSLHPDIDWQVWDGKFKDVYEDREVKYDHAWIFGKDKATGERYLVDLSRNDKERLFIVVGSNRYPKDHPEYICMKEISRERLDWMYMFREEEEYNTGLRGIDFIAELTPYMTKVLLGG